ncbi:MAG: protein jag [Lachnospiraceae bacterium]|nr:protein jag [Lachnospiraceae bacterium]
MRNWIETTGKTVEEALLEASIALNTTAENIDYEVIDEAASGFLGINKKPAKIKAALKESKIDKAANFISDVLNVMGIKNEVKSSYDEDEMTMNFEIVGENMGMLIGKRGQTLDSLQYLVSLVVNKESEDYIKVKLDTENYRERRKQTLENLAKNIGSKVKKSGKSVALEPMNPYERRIIHSALQDDKYVETHSEGEEPFRKVVISLKKGVRPYNKFHNNNRGGYGNNRGGYGNKKGGYGSRSAFNKKSNKPREPYRYGNIEEGEVYEGVTATIDPSEQI